MKNELRQKIVLLVCFVLLPVSASAYTLKWAHFNPAVVLQNATGTADLLCYAEGTFTSIMFKPSWSANELQLENRGAGIYGITLNISDLINGLASDDVNRKFVGYLQVYNNATLVDGSFNIFIDVLTPDIPEASSILLGGDVQVSLHLFNMLGAYDTPLDLITKKFYSYFNDDYDFIAIIYDESRFLNRTYMGVKNDVQNIGPYIFDNSSYYGSSGKLQGIIQFPIPEYFDLAEEGAIHEIGHRWINYLNITPLSLGIPHWPVSTLANDIMGFTIPGSGGVGGSFPYTITQVGEDQWQLAFDLSLYNSPGTFSDLSLYLMGLIPSNEVGNHIVFLNQNQSISDGAIWSGPVANINGAYIVGQLGERVPNYLNSQKGFRIATILLTKDQLAPTETMRLYDWFAARSALTTRTPVHEGLWKTTSNPFYLATGGRATLASTLIAGSFGYLDHFEVSAISSPQAVGVPFSVTITKKDAFGNTQTSWNGEVVLNSYIGNVSPIRTYLTNGTATINVTLDSPGCNVTLQASGGGKSGVSNYFTVSGGSSNASIGGTVRDGSGVRRSGANVKLTGDCLSTAQTVVTDSKGEYRFSSLNPGEYSIQAFDGPADCSSCGKSSVVVKPISGNVTQDLIVPGSSCNPQALTPILLVPGIMGSSIGGGSVYPVLPKTAPKWNEFIYYTDSWGLHDPMRLAGWRNLVDELGSADSDYKVGCTIFPVPYDWRMDLDDAAMDYLKPWIDEAKRQAGTAKVNVIAHSMGGLVTRAYIQVIIPEMHLAVCMLCLYTVHGTAPLYYIGREATLRHLIPFLSYTLHLAMQLPLLSLISIREPLSCCTRRCINYRWPRYFLFTKYRCTTSFMVMFLQRNNSCLHLVSLYQTVN